MKLIIILTSITLLTATQTVLAECTSTFAYGQVKQDCSHSNNESTEYSEVPYNGNVQISRDQKQQKKLASLEQSVNQAQAAQSPFKPTHTQLNQVIQLLDYAQSQGCTWEGKFDQPQLSCPK